LLGRRVTEAFFDDLQVGTTGEQPGGMCMPHVVNPDAARSAALHAGSQTWLRNQSAGMCPSVSRARGVRGLSFPPARRLAR
jgi:hypothetical protein